MQEPFVHVVYSRNVIEFITVAREFCNLIESSENYKKKQFIEICLKMLPLLYLKGVSLPKTSPELEDSTNQYVTEMGYESIKASLEFKLGAHNDYLEVFTMDIARSETAIPASIAEDLSDIYQDLKDFLGNYRTGATEIMNDALYELNNNFEINWGQKNVNCLRALHNCFYSGDDLEEEEVIDNNESEKRNTDDWILSRRRREWQSDDDQLLL